MTHPYNDIAAIRALDAARTQGQWTTRDPFDSWRNDYCAEDHCSQQHSSGDVEIPELLDHEGDPLRFHGPDAEANAAFVAAATVFISPLCDEVEHLRERQRKLLELGNVALEYQRARVASAMHPRSDGHRNFLHAAGLDLEVALRKAGFIS